LLGITQAQGELISYPDVAAGDAYEREIRLASQSGIFKGYEDGSFRGDQIISREELAAVLERALIYMEMTDGLDPEAASRFADADLIGFWSVDSVGRLTDAGLVEFELNASYRPQEQATKAEVALMVANFLRMIGMIQ
jgi:hypothetical protein